MKKIIKLNAISLLAVTSLSDAHHSKESVYPPVAKPNKVVTEHFLLPEDLEVTVWATTPQLYNPTNMDIDEKGRIWVCEGVRYRKHKNRKKADRVVVLQDTNGDGKADSSHTFVEEELLMAPLGIGVFGNKVYVSQPPSLIVYTDVDRNLKFDPKVDKREVLFTGFNARGHDHSLHSVTGGPDGNLYFNVGNCGAQFKDKEGGMWNLGGSYKGGGGTEYFFDPTKIAGKASADGHVYIPGATFRMNADGSNIAITGQGYRNSYEQSGTSFGDWFQNDNDDPPACRVSYILEYGSAGYFSRDGKRNYRSETRKGQSHQRNHWRQDDPGTMDAGDIYGGGSPSGVLFYENGALGEKYIGTLFSCEPGRNTIFSYQPKPKGGTFSLDRNNFLTTNKNGEFIGSDFTKKFVKKVADDESFLLFRPSDISVGPDGALYMCDWYDARVGGHTDMDDSLSGTIYRIAPKGFKPQVPKYDLTTVAGAVEGLRSSAISPRFTAHHALRAYGKKAYLPVVELLNDKNPFIAARAIWLLPYLGEQGVKKCESLLENADPQIRVAAYRALRHSGADILPYAKKMALDEDHGVRRDVAISLRNIPVEKTQEIFLELAKRVDVNDKNSLEAIGIGAALQEGELWKFLNTKLGTANPEDWDERFTRLTWRLWPLPAVPALKQRALSTKLTPEQRAFAAESLAFIDHPDAMNVMLELAKDGSPCRQAAFDWLILRGPGEWKKHGAMKLLKDKGLFDPDKLTVTPVTIPSPPKKPSYTVADVLKLKGDAEKGKAKIMSCVLCHQVNGAGPNYGPNLKGWGKGQPRETIVRAIVEPSADIAHGYEGTVVKLKDGGEVQGLMLRKTDPMQIISTGGQEQMIPRSKMKSLGRFKRSLMLSSEQLGLKPQDVADIVSYMQEY